jgi:DNA-binding MarR family transcriptional regulator
MNTLDAADHRNLTEQQRTFGALLRGAYQALARRVYGELAERGYGDVRIAHGAVFRHIAPAGSRITELADRAQMTKQSMGSLVEYLRERGYVELQPDPADGRAKRVLLTERGRTLQQTALEISAQAERELSRLLGEGKLAQLRGLLEELNDTLHP